MNKEDLQDFGIGLIIFPFSHVIAQQFAHDWINISEPLNDSVHIFGPRVQGKSLTRVDYRASKYTTPLRTSHTPGISWFLLYAVKLLLVELEMCLFILRSRKKCNHYLFFLGPYFLIPQVLCRLLGRSVVILYSGSDEALSASSFSRTPAAVVRLIAAASHRTADLIVVESESLRREALAHSPNGRVVSGCARFIDLESFYPMIPNSMREPVVGYVGRMSLEKGIVQSLPALARLLVSQDKIRLVLVGDGPELNSIRDFARKWPKERVVLNGWVDRGLMPKMLNEIRVLLIPSSTEGLPTVALESMACGTIIVAADVGGLHDIIIHGHTGYIVPDMSEESLVSVLAEALFSGNSDRIADSARSLISSEYSLESARKRFSNLIGLLHG